MVQCQRLKLLFSDIQPQHKNLKFTAGLPESDTTNKEQIYRVKNLNLYTANEAFIVFFV